MKRPVNPVGAKGSKYRGLTLASSRSVERIVNGLGDIGVGLFQGDEVLKSARSGLTLCSTPERQGERQQLTFSDTIKASHPVLCLGCVQFYFALSYGAL